MPIQSVAEIESSYATPDPWNYDGTPDDQLRVEAMLAELPAQSYRRTLDIGCGNGFLTSRLPGNEVVGVDISEKAIEWARKRCPESRYRFENLGIFDLSPDKLGAFDLIVITGVLYPEYIGAAFSLAQLKIDQLLQTGGTLAHAHIMDWFKGGFSYDTVSVQIYNYREYHHILEIYRK